MPSTTQSYGALRTDPIIVSVVVAPQHRNPATSSVVIVGLSPRRGPADRLYESNFYPALRTAWERFLSRHLPDCASLTGGNSNPTPATVPDFQTIVVPPRHHPFATHIDLLSDTVEGLSFDPDDYVER